MNKLLVSQADLLSVLIKKYYKFYNLPALHFYVIAEVLFERIMNVVP